MEENNDERRIVCCKEEILGLGGTRNGKWRGFAVLFVVLSTYVPISVASCDQASFQRWYHGRDSAYTTRPPCPTKRDIEYQVEGLDS